MAVSYLNQCRICLEYDAVYPIFDNKDDHLSVYSKLNLCLKEKIEDLDGYPRHICAICNNSLDLVFKFVNKYKQTCEILQSNLPCVKPGNDNVDGKVTIELIKTEIDPNIYFDEDRSDNLSDKDSDMLKLEPTVEITVHESGLSESLHNLPNITIRKCSLNEEKSVSNDTASCRKKKDLPRVNDKKELNSLSTKSSKSKKSDKSVSKNTTKRKRNLKSPVEGSVANKKTGVNKTGRKERRKESKNYNRLCEHCGKDFDCAEKFWKHKITHNKSSIRHRCASCKEQFLSRYHLRIHKEKTHTDASKYVCSHCNLAFYYYKSLITHLQRTHPENAPPKRLYKCTTCSKAFRSPENLKNHVRTNHTGEFPFSCQFCGHAFAAKSYLRDHLRQHTGEMPFKCPICGKPHAQNCNMKSHIRHNHRLRDLDEETLKKLHPRFLKFLKAD